MPEIPREEPDPAAAGGRVATPADRAAAAGPSEPRPALSAGANPEVDVFVSYASHDAALADSLVAALEQHGIRCWIAPRDVVPGSLYADGIVRAIQGAKVFTLVLSEHSLASPHVGKELERASSKRRPVIALRTDSAPLSPAFEYFLSESQWLQVGADGIATTAATLAAAVRRHLDALAGPGGEALAASGAFAPIGAGARFPGRGAATTRSRSLVAAVAGLALTVALLAYVVSGHSLLSPRGPAEPRPASVPAEVDDKSIAVLPFADLSEKKDQEYFADGMAEELVDLLTKIPGLRVPARTSSFYFKGKQATIADIAKVLRVAHVLEGSVRKSGNTMRITAQLIRADNGYHVWSETFDRPLTDVFKVQDEIAAAVVKILRVSLMEAATPKGAMTTSTDAYALYLQARALERNAGEGDFTAAVGTLQRAVALDPAFATAWAEIVFALLGDLSWHGDGQAQGETCTRAAAAADRALALAPQLAEAHRAKAAVHSNCEQRYADAVVEIKRALELDPQNAAAWGAYSWQMVRAGRYEDAIRYAQEGVSRDPLNVWAYFPLACAQGYAGQFAAAEATYRKAIEFSPTPTPAGLHALHANSLLGLNDPAAALTANALESDDQFRQMNLPLIYDALGRKADAEREIAVFERKYSKRDPLTMAEFYACRGDAGRAVPWLAGFASQPQPIDDVPNRIACLRKIETDPRYRALAARWRTGARPHA